MLALVRGTGLPIGIFTDMLTLANWHQQGLLSVLVIFGHELLDKLKF